MGPGFVDLQLNGYVGVDFNTDDLSAEALHAACEQFEADGNAGVLATVITDELDFMCARMSRFARLRAVDEVARRVIWDFHAEREKRWCLRGRYRANQRMMLTASWTKPWRNWEPTGSIL